MISENNNTYNEDIAILETKVDHISARLTKLEDIITKLYALDKSIDKMESRVGNVEEKLKNYEVQVLELRSSLNNNFGSMKDYFKDTIEKKLDHISITHTTTSVVKPAHTEDKNKLLELGGVIGRVFIIVGLIIAGVLGIPIK